MHLHIANLPQKVSKNDLDSLFGRLAKPHCFRTFKKRTRDGKVLHYAYMNVDSEVAGKKVIRRYDNASMQGTRITVRSLVARRVDNERRDVNWRRNTWQRPERRAGERRMSHIEVEVFELMGSAGAPVGS